MSTEQQPKKAEGSNNQILYRRKGTVRPDKIGLRMVTIGKAHIEDFCRHVF
jgi:hypothetical protein